MISTLRTNANLRQQLDDARQTIASQQITIDAQRADLNLAGQRRDELAGQVAELEALYVLRIETERLNRAEQSGPRAVPTRRKRW